MSARDFRADEHCLNRLDQFGTAPKRKQHRCRRCGRSLHRGDSIAAGQCVGGCTKKSS